MVPRAGADDPDVGAGLYGRQIAPAQCADREVGRERDSDHLAPPGLHNQRITVELFDHVAHRVRCGIKAWSQRERKNANSQRVTGQQDIHSLEAMLFTLRSGWRR